MIYLTSVSASLFLLSSVKAPEKAQTMVFKELQHEDTNQRINAVLRYHLLALFRPDMYANSADPVQMQQNAASDQGLHCLLQECLCKIQ